MLDFSTLFEAIAITALAKQTWPTFEPGRARVMTVPLKRDAYGEYQVYNLSPLEPGWPPLSDSQLFYTSEQITLGEFWTGSQFIYMGYGPHTDTLVIGLMRN